MAIKDDSAHVATAHVALGGRAAQGGEDGAYSPAPDAMLERVRPQAAWNVALDALPRYRPMPTGTSPFSRFPPGAASSRPPAAHRPLVFTLPTRLHAIAAPGLLGPRL
jgi:hypothetical protein